MVPIAQHATSFAPSYLRFLTTPSAIDDFAIAATRSILRSRDRALDDLPHRALADLGTLMEPCFAAKLCSIGVVVGDPTGGRSQVIGRVEILGVDLFCDRWLVDLALCSCSMPCRKTRNRRQFQALFSCGELCTAAV